MAVTCKFVDRVPTSGQTTRLDLNDGTTFTLLADGSDFSPPPLRRSFADGGVVEDGSRVRASAYENRVVTLRLLVDAATQDALATNLQNLARELDRTRNILRFKGDGATNDVYFRTYRSPEYDLDVDPHNVGTTHAVVTVPILAEPFAYGDEEEATSITVDNDPEGTNPLIYDLTTVKGDAPTPARIAVRGATGVNPRQLFVSVHRHGDPTQINTTTGTATSYAWQAEDMTQGTDTSVQANDTTASGSGSNYSRCTFSTATMTTRLTISAFGVARAEFMGLWRGFVRVRKSSSGSSQSFSIRLSYGDFNADGASTDLDSVTFTGAGQTLDEWDVLDLGVFQVPRGPYPDEDGFSGESALANGVTIEIGASRDSGTESLDFDYFAAMPLMDESMVVEAIIPDSSDNPIVLDGTSGLIYGNSATSVDNERDFPFAGRIPLLTPGITNRLFFTRSGGNQDQENELITDDLTITSLSYWPRYLFVQPA